MAMFKFYLQTLLAQYQHDVSACKKLFCASVYINWLME